MVLLGGSGLGPWAWERVIPILRDRGIASLTPQLRGTGDDPTSPAALSLNEWIDDLATFLDDDAPDDVVLVAHSFAGYVAAGLLERDPSAISSVVFLDAVLPTPERSWFDVMGPDVEAFMRGHAEDEAILFLTRQQLDQFYPGHGLSEDDWAWMQSMLRAQHVKTLAQPAITRPLDLEQTRLAYVLCLRTVPPPADIIESTPGWTFRTLPTGHWPMISDPDATANVLQDLVIP